MEMNVNDVNVITVSGKRYRVILEEITETNKSVLSIKDVCEIYGFSKNKVYNMIRMGKFPPNVIIKKEGSATKFNAHEFDEFYKNGM